MGVTWTQVDREDILDVIRADLTVGEQFEIASMDDEAFTEFVRRLWGAVQAHFDEQSQYEGIRAYHGRPDGERCVEEG